MSTKDEILEMLRKNPKGMTSKELAPHCPSAECDQMIVGRMVGALGQENLIHSSSEGFREGAMIWLIGPKEAAAVEARITLPWKPLPQKSEITRAAQDIAALRQKPPASRSERDSGYPTTPATTTAPAPARPAVQQETPMSDKKPIKERVRDALEKHGKRQLSQLAKDVGTTPATLSAMMGKLKDEGIVKPIAGERGVYELGSNKQPAPPRGDPAPKKERKPKKLKKAKPAKVRKVKRKAPAAPAAPARAPNGNGHAQFAINEQGELGIEKDELKVRLGPTEFTRLREFIERTQPVWKGAE